MNISQVIRFAVIDRQADSLHSLIADGQYRSTSLGRDAWKALIGSRGSLQTYCNKTGFNVVGKMGIQKIDPPRARIGIISNDFDHCITCDSRIGFGTGGSPKDSNVCGNAAHWKWKPDNGGNNIKAIGYILVQWNKNTRTLKGQIQLQ